LLDVGHRSTSDDWKSLKLRADRGERQSLFDRASICHLDSASSLV